MEPMEQLDKSWLIGTRISPRVSQAKPLLSANSLMSSYMYLYPMYIFV